MVWFQCEDCGETLKKPKLKGHCGRCPANQLVCIDCGEVFDKISVQLHMTCMTEMEKFGPKGPNAAAGRPGSASAGGSGTGGGAKGRQADEGLDFTLGLSKKPPWTCSLCKVTATSEGTLLSHSEGKKHRSKVRGAAKAAAATTAAAGAGAATAGAREGAREEGTAPAPPSAAGEATEGGAAGNLEGPPVVGSGTTTARAGGATPHNAAKGAEANGRNKREDKKKRRQEMVEVRTADAPASGIGSCSTILSSSPSANGSGQPDQGARAAGTGTMVGGEEAEGKRERKTKQKKQVAVAASDIRVKPDSGVGGRGEAVGGKEAGVASGGAGDRGETGSAREGKASGEALLNGKGGRGKKRKQAGVVVAKQGEEGAAGRTDPDGAPAKTGDGADVTKPANATDVVAVPWKKLIKKILKKDPSHSLPLKRLRVEAVAEVGQYLADHAAEGAGGGGGGTREDLLRGFVHALENSEVFVKEGKRIVLKPTSD